VAGTFYVQFPVGDLCAYDFPKGTILARFTFVDDVTIDYQEFPDGSWIGNFTEELEILEATGIYRSFVGWSHPYGGQTGIRASDGALIEHCFCHYSRKTRQTIRVVHEVYLRLTGGVARSNARIARTSSASRRGDALHPDRQRLYQRVLAAPASEARNVGGPRPVPMSENLRKAKPPLAPAPPVKEELQLWEGQPGLKLDTRPDLLRFRLPVDGTLSPLCPNTN
jgi:hypothetical protein